MTAVREFGSSAERKRRETLPPDDDQRSLFE